jgi:hypothetical protein
MIRTFIFAIAVLGASSGAWAAERQDKYDSPEDRACRADARRFCRNAIPDQFRVASCLQEHRNRLSRACRAVLESHGM